MSTPHDLLPIQNAIAAQGCAIAIWAMIETPLAIGNLYAIAAAARAQAPALSALLVGTNDLVKEMRMDPSSARSLLAPFLLSCVGAARAYGLSILDGVHNGLDDEQAFILECQQGRAMGMDGKSLIHPRQIAPCNRIFSASPEETAWAKRIVAAFASDDNRNAGVLNLDGQMVERLHLDMAQRLLASPGG